jgi:hypothetical protein
MRGVLAHGIGGREDLPLPLGWAVAGAAVAVVVSFVALGMLWHEPRLRAATAGRPLPGWAVAVLDSRATRVVLGGLGLAATVWTLLALVLGPEDANNPVPWVVFVLLWVGIVPVSALLGPVWRRLNPLRTVHALVNRAAGLDPADGVRPLPAGIGWWPSAVGLGAFAWFELAYEESTTLPALRWAIGLYAAVHLVAAFTFGSRWFDRGDAFEAWSGLYGRISPLGRRPDGTLVLRAPLVGLDALPPAPGLVATVSVMLGSTVYDGLSGSTVWVTFAQSQSVPRTLISTAGLFLTIAAVAGLLVVCTRAAGRLGGADDVRALPGLLAPSVVPVALGYVVAHYYSFLVLEGQNAFVKLTDPLGTGADWLGTAGLEPSAALVTPGIVANLQVVAIVVGHVLGVVVAHDRAVSLFPRARAVLGQVPLLVLMVTLTCTGLFLLFAG